ELGTRRGTRAPLARRSARRGLHRAHAAALLTPVADLLPGRRLRRELPEAPHAPGFRAHPAHRRTGLPQIRGRERSAGSNLRALDARCSRPATRMTIQEARE